MKRFWVTIVLIGVLLGIMLHFMPKPFESFVSQMPSDCEVYVYCRETSHESICMGNGFLVRCSRDELSRVLQSCRGVDGISVKMLGTKQQFEDLQRTFKLQTYQTLNFDGISVVCGNSPKVCGGVTLDGKIVNLQIAFDGGTVTVGFPLILDSF